MTSWLFVITCCLSSLYCSVWCEIWSQRGHTESLSHWGGVSRPGCGRRQDGPGGGWIVMHLLVALLRPDVLFWGQRAGALLLLQEWPWLWAACGEVCCLGQGDFPRPRAPSTEGWSPGSRLQPSQQQEINASVCRAPEPTASMWHCCFLPKSHISSKLSSASGCWSVCWIICCFVAMRTGKPDPGHLAQPKTETPESVRLHTWPNPLPPHAQCCLRPFSDDWWHQSRSENRSRLHPGLGRHVSLSSYRSIQPWTFVSKAQATSPAPLKPSPAAAPLGSSETRPRSPAGVEKGTACPQALPGQEIRIPQARLCPWQWLPSLSGQRHIPQLQTPPAFLISQLALFSSWLSGGWSEPPESEADKLAELRGIYSTDALTHAEKACTLGNFLGSIPCSSKLFEATSMPISQELIK